MREVQYLRLSLPNHHLRDLIGEEVSSRKINNAGVGIHKEGVDARDQEAHESPYTTCIACNLSGDEGDGSEESSMNEKWLC